jgi:tRNA-(ms[2]io[6]A)-hydroxylase
VDHFTRGVLLCVKPSPALETNKPIGIKNFLKSHTYFCGMDSLSASAKAILGLQLPTDPRWVNLASTSIAEVLTDHAYCEQKAAVSCISLIQRYSSKEELVVALAPVVTEEWGHFRMVLAELHKRSLKLGAQRKDVYVAALLQFVQKGGSEDGRFLDQLLMMALIEARSCERFKRLSEGLQDDYLKKWYRRFMESEAGHYTLFLELAETYIEHELVRRRWAQWLQHEAEILKTLEVRGDRMH